MVFDFLYFHQKKKKNKKQRKVFGYYKKSPLVSYSLSFKPPKKQKDLFAIKSHSHFPHNFSTQQNLSLSLYKTRKMEVSARKPCFIEEDDDLASSLTEMEAGFSGNNGNSQNSVVSSPFSYARLNSLRNTNYQSYYHQYSVLSPRSVVSGRFHDFRFDNQQPHFLDSCFLCKKPLGDNRDIYMYR